MGGVGAGAGEEAAEGGEGVRGTSDSGCPRFVDANDGSRAKGFAGRMYEVSVQLMDGHKRASCHVLRFSNRRLDPTTYSCACLWLFGATAFERFAASYFRCIIVRSPARR